MFVLRVVHRAPVRYPAAHLLAIGGELRVSHGTVGAIVPVAAGRAVKARPTSVNTEELRDQADPCHRGCGTLFRA